MKHIFGCAALLIAGISVGAGAAPITQSAMLTNFNVRDLDEIAKSIGYESEILTAEDGTKAIGVTSTNGIRFIAIPEVCNAPAGCIGLEIFATFGSDQLVPPTTLNSFNVERVFTKAYSSDGTIYLSRYEIADFGIPAGNIASNFTNFVAVAEDFQDFLLTGGLMSSLAPQTVPDASLPTPGFAARHSTALAKQSVELPKGAEKYANPVAHTNKPTPLMPKPAMPLGPPAIR